MIKINKKHAPQSGNIISGDGEIYNIVDILGGAQPLSDKTYDINKYAPHGGKVIGSDGKVYDLVKLLQNAGGGNGSGSGTPKDYLMVMLTEHQTVMLGDTVIFDRVVNGTIPYDTTTGRVTLQHGKVYKITIDAGATGHGWVVMGLLDATTTDQSPEEGFYPLLLPAVMNDGTVRANSRSFIFTPNSTRDFHVVITSALDDLGEYQIRAVNSSLTIVEI